MIEQYGIVGADRIEFVAGRMAPFGELVVVIARADHPDARWTRGGSYSDRGHDLFDRPGDVWLDCHLGQRGSISAHVIVGIVETRRDRRTRQVHDRRAGRGELAPFADTDYAIPKNRDTRSPRPRSVDGEHCCVIDYQIREHASTLPGPRRSIRIDHTAQSVPRSRGTWGGRDLGPKVQTMLHL